MRRADPQISFAPAPAAEVAAGVFETILVVDGRPIEARRHLERLKASARLLYGVRLAHGLPRQVESVAAGHALARLRISAFPRKVHALEQGAATELSVEIAPLDPAVVLAPADVDLATVSVSAGAGPHKLIDRGWLEQIEAAAGEGVRPLLLTRAGTLLETTRANLFLLRDGALATPPFHGSILPGVTRAVVLEQAERLGVAARERPLTLADLREADLVLLSSSLRLLERARCRRPGRRSGEAAARLMDALDPRGS